VRACVHMGECSYVYEYPCLYCVSQKKSAGDKCLHYQQWFQFRTVADKTLINNGSQLEPLLISL
jgi:hypothetical protein